MVTREFHLETYECKTKSSRALFGYAYKRILDRNKPKSPPKASIKFATPPTSPILVPCHLSHCFFYLFSPSSCLLPWHVINIREIFDINIYSKTQKNWSMTLGAPAWTKLTRLHGTFFFCGLIFQSWTYLEVFMELGRIIKTGTHLYREPVKALEHGRLAGY